MSQQGPRISTIVAVYNSAETLQRCIDSVAAQTYMNRELIVIDGASTDGSVEIIRSNASALTYWQSEPDRGVYHAWNKGLDRATGDWIHFLGSDDCYTAPDVLERLAEELAGLTPDVGLAYAKLARVTSSGKVLEYWGRPWDQIRPRLLGEMLIPHGATLHHTSLFKQYGKFEETFRIAGDYEFVLRTLKHTDVRFISQIVLISQRWDGMSSLPHSAFLRNAEMVKARRMNRLPAYPLSGLSIYTENLLYGTLHLALGERGAIAVQNIYRRLTGRPPVPPRKER